MTTATFEADGFSIYAIVETGEDARVLVKFMNGSTEIESMYVKSADAAKISTVLYDPGAGTIPEGAYFRGW
ncbi:MAG: hypothetical protein II510_09050, partial [Erysipelotrichales bacterium]|nr:hypothetical protein [Erysipelotrichales bacterium]